MWPLNINNMPRLRYIIKNNLTSNIVHGRNNRQSFNSYVIFVHRKRLRSTFLYIGIKINNMLSLNIKQRTFLRLNKNFRLDY